MTEPDKIELKITENENDSDPIISTCAYNILVDDAENLRIKADDINSADDVRQEIKLLLKDKIYKSTSKENVTITNKTQKDLKILGDSKTVSINCNLPEDCNQITLASNTLRLVSGAGDSVKLRKRPGRPPKAGPSKKQRLQRSSLFYVGKLCNVRRGYDSDYTNSD